MSEVRTGKAEAKKQRGQKKQNSLAVFASFVLFAFLLLCPG
jgi:hypothetical protein